MNATSTAPAPSLHQRRMALYATAARLKRRQVLTDLIRTAGTRSNPGAAGYAYLLPGSGWKRVSLAEAESVLADLDR